jgi:hypothetical protein
MRCHWKVPMGRSFASKSCKTGLPLGLKGEHWRQAGAGGNRKGDTHCQIFY